MLEEFVIEPEAFSDNGVLLQAMEQVGVEHGRIVVMFPRSWLKSIYDQFQITLKDTERTRLANRLKRLKQQAFFPQQLLGRKYNGELDWRENVLQQHEAKPFHAVIQCDNPGEHEFVLTPDELEQTNPYWRVERSSKIIRSPASLIEAMSPLAVISNDLHFVDPYFNGDPRWTKVFIPVINTRMNTRSQNQSRFCIHTTQKMSKVHWQKTLERNLAPSLPENTSVNVIIWESKDDKERMYARYFMTDKGGMSFDSGLDSRPDDTTDVSLMSHTLYEARLKELGDESKSFSKVEQFNICRSGVR